MRDTYFCEDIVQILYKYNKLIINKNLIFYFYIILFAIRSTKGIKRLTSTERAAIQLSGGQKDILVGILLGDGHISRRSLTSNSRLHYGQTTKHKEYF